MSSRLEVSVLPTGVSSVDGVLGAFFDDCPHSFAQQTPDWRNVITGVDTDEAMFLGCRRDGELVGVLPAYRYEGPLGAILTSAAQAGPLGGVACSAEPAQPVYEALLDAFLELAASRGCALATLLTNPIWPDRELCEAAFEPDFVLENSCLVLDLDHALDSGGEVVAESTHLKRNLRRAQSDALSIDELQTVSNVETWYEIHRLRHSEIGARPLPLALFTGALRHMVPAGKARFFFVRLTDSGEMVAGGFYVCHGTVIDALMPSVKSEFAKLAPNYRLAAHSMRWAHEHGYRHYNWQASPPDGGVYRFKQQWGSHDHDYAYLTRVTGDAAPFLNSDPETIAQGYPWHYVLPFDRLGSGPRRGTTSSRKDAWHARRGEPS